MVTMINNNFTLGKINSNIGIYLKRANKFDNKGIHDGSDLVNPDNNRNFNQKFLLTINNNSI